MAAYGDPNHARLYGLDFKGKPGEVGFFVDVIDYGEELPAEAVVRYKLSNKSELSLLLTKRLQPRLHSPSHSLLCDKPHSRPKKRRPSHSADWRDSIGTPLEYFNSELSNEIQWRCPS
jgi:hypothetical protein